MLWEAYIALSTMLGNLISPQMRLHEIDLSVYPEQVLRGWDYDVNDAMQAPTRRPKPWEPQTKRDRDNAARVLHNRQGDIRYPSRAVVMNNTIADITRRWPGYPGPVVIPFVIDPTVDPKYFGVLNRAIEQYNELTCIKFKPAREEPNHIKITSDIADVACYSYVGHVGGSQQLQLHPDCMYVGTIVHELGHALGFGHEHQRADRDNYLTIFPRNIMPGKEYVSQFTKTPRGTEIAYNKFDYSSIMIYSEYSFSKDPDRLKTMVAKNGFHLEEPYDKPGLDNSDIERVNCMYKCKRCKETIL